MRMYNQTCGKAVTGILLALLLIAAVGAVVWYGLGPSRARIDERTTLSILRSEAMTFLVTRKLATQIVVQYEESDWLGEWRGVLWATVRMYHGVDLKKIEASDIRRAGDTIVVRLPQPELLDFSVEPGSVGVLTKSTAVPKVLSILRNGHRKQLEKALRQRALEFAGRQGMLPTREEIVWQLNTAMLALTVPAGVNIRFE